MAEDVIEIMNNWLSRRLAGYFQANPHAYVHSCADMLGNYLRDQGVSDDELSHRSIDLHQFVANYFNVASGRA